MRSCKFYSPGKSLVESHDGFAMSDDYEFDRPMQPASCMNEEMIAQMGGGAFTQCGYEREPVSCPMYEPEELTILRRVHILGSADELQLSVTRVKFGIVEFYITLGDEQPTCLHTVNAHEYGEQAQEFAVELFDYELEERGEFRELPLPEAATTSSYLQEVVNEVRTAS